MYLSSRGYSTKVWCLQDRRIPIGDAWKFSPCSFKQHQNKFPSGIISSNPNAMVETSPLWLITTRDLPRDWICTKRGYILLLNTFSSKIMDTKTSLQCNSNKSPIRHSTQVQKKTPRTPGCILEMAVKTWRNSCKATTNKSPSHRIPSGHNRSCQVVMV
jgi:hypothetical protein